MSDYQEHKYYSGIGIEVGITEDTGKEVAVIGLVLPGEEEGDEDVGYMNLATAKGLVVGLKQAIKIIESGKWKE